MNIMLITVTERTREIGIRRAVGCRQRTLLFQFLLEAGLISLSGGIFGILIGLGLNYLLTILVSISWDDWVLRIDPVSIVAGLIVSFLTGIIFGFYPALKATRLTPEQCLRYE
ncbi:FtsX-like permease family protein [bacterium]|nr:FtsX-like permease family protein [bacterium]